MRIGSTLAVFAVLSVLLAACASDSASVSPSSSPPTAAPSAIASGGASAAASAGPTSELVIGVVTDVATDNEKESNEAIVVGTQQGAVAIGADPPPVVIPTSTDLYAPLIQAMVEQDFDVIVTTGVDLIPATVAAAKANPNTWFIGVDQAPCLDDKGAHDPTGKQCTGDGSTLLPRYIATSYAEDQAGYLAGMVAASATKSKIIGAIGGVSLCGPCVRFMQGYVLGARSVDPTIKVKTAFLSPTDYTLGFADQAAGAAFTSEFLEKNARIDVLFQAAGLTGAGSLTGKGIIDAGCAAGIKVIGVDVDQHQTYPDSQRCILTSAEKHLSSSVTDTMVGISTGTAKGGRALFDASNGGIGISPFYDAAGVLPADIQARVDGAISRMKAGSLVTCPPAPACGMTPAPRIGD